MGNKKITISIDLDHTLLDTEALKVAFARALVPLGVTREQFWKAYRQLRKGAPFTIASFATLVATNPRIRSRAVALLTQVTKHATRYLYPDALPFLRAMRRAGARIVFFSYGYPPYIRMKLTSISNYKKLFDRIVITEKEKKNVRLPKWNVPAIMIDNRADVLSFYARRYGMQPFLLCRECPHRDGHGALLTYHSLKAIARTISLTYFA